MSKTDDAIEFYDSNYEIVGSWLVKPDDNVTLGNAARRRCRFCGKTETDVTFRKKAHAIPEALGNKSIVSVYECDVCNEFFGKGIENDLGNWSKPMRTLARIRGKSGVPTLKKGGTEPGWRIDYDSSGFKIKSYQNDPVYELDEGANTITFNLKRDPYIPVAVLKAFMKVGLTLMPDDEIANFRHAISWIREPNHSIPFAEKSPIIYTFQPGPMPNNLIAAFVLRRRPNVAGFPYAFLVIGYGNEVFQVQLPSAQRDATLNGQSYSILPFPTPGSPDPERFGQPRRGLIDLTGRERVRGEIVPITVGYEKAVQSEPSQSEAK